MLRDITIGQFYNTKSLIHSLDPRTKITALLILTIEIFTLQGAAQYALMTLFAVTLIFLSRVPVAFILKGMKPVWLIIAFTALINLFFGNGETVLVQWGFLCITKEALTMSVKMAMRVILLVNVSNLLTLTTSPMVISTGIEKLLKPLEIIKFPSHEIAMMMSIALRFIPTLSYEAEKIMKAQASRGNDFESGNIAQKVKGMIPLFVPLFVSAFRRADDLAMAMECRCYNGGKNRTSFKILRYKKCDIISFVIIGIVTALLILCRIFGV